jgi:hypothetical protein
VCGTGKRPAAPSHRRLGGGLLGLDGPCHMPEGPKNGEGDVRGLVSPRRSAGARGDGRTFRRSAAEPRRRRGVRPRRVGGARRARAGHSDAASHAVTPALRDVPRRDSERASAHDALVPPKRPLIVASSGLGARGLPHMKRPPRGLDMGRSAPSDHLLATRSVQAAAESLPSAAERRPALPAPPGFREQWGGPRRLFPVRTPATVVSRPNGDLNAAPSVCRRPAGPGGEAGAPSPEEYTASVRSDAGRRGPLVRAPGATAG